jgi:CDP-paratose 2-epimerase
MAGLNHDDRGHEAHGIDNNVRRELFHGDQSWNLDPLRSATRRLTHHTIDIRDRAALNGLFTQARFDAIIHRAAQPSHEEAKDIPLADFAVNALGTTNVLEARRQHCPEARFCSMSATTVDGDAPNKLPLSEFPSRWEYADPAD